MKLAAGLRIVGLLLWLGPPAGATPPGVGGVGGVDGVAIDVDPPEVYLHEQVILEVSFSHAVAGRPAWEAPLFEGFWVERLGTVSSAAEPSARGEPRRRTSFRRALVPSRIGTLDVPPSSVRWEDGAGAEHGIEVPGARVRVRPLPDGAPERFSGVVGELEVASYVSLHEAELGHSVRLIIDLHGRANVWDAPDPDPDRFLPEGVEAFPVRPRLATGDRNGRLTARRSFVFDLVPDAIGPLVVQPIEVSYFDPVRARYTVARSDPVTIRVVPGLAPRPSAAAGSTPSAPRSPVPWVGPILALAAAGLVVGVLLARWWRHEARAALGPAPPSPRNTFEAACAAIGTEPFPRLLADAVKAGVHVRHHFDARALTTEEIEARIGDEPVISLLRTLDRARFARTVDNPEALLSDVRRYLKL